MVFGCFLMCAFAASTVGQRAASTARSNLAAVRAWHIEDGVPYASTGSTQLTYVLRGIENVRPASSFKPPRSPVSRSMLEMLCQHLDDSCGLDAAVKACATVRMYGQARLGELLSSSGTDYSRVPCGRDLHPPVTPAGPRVLHLPFTKPRVRRAPILFFALRNCLSAECTLMLSR
jgi:hypothetical protein